MRNNLLNSRKNKGFTQNEIAKKIGITERQYRRLEAGTSNSSIAVWQHLKELLDVKTIDFLLQNNDITE